MPRNALMDFAQSASNAIAQNVSGPVDLIGSGLRAVGVPVPQNSYGSSQWMEQRGLTKPVPMGAARIAGETFGMVAPTVAAANAAKIAAWHRKVDEVMAQGAKAVGQTAADKAGNYMAQSGLIQPATVWHGSPHKFDKFDSTKIGSGEGAQAYGHGLYLAESPKVADEYAGKLSAKYVVIDGFEDSDPVVKRVLDKLSARANRTQYGGASSQAKQDLHAIAKGKDAESAVAQRMLAKLGDFGLPEVLDAGNLYKVDLPDEQIAKMLDWNKPLSQQKRDVLRALRKDEKLLDATHGKKWPGSMYEEPSGPWRPRNDSGADVVANLRGVYGSDAKAVEALRQAGIPGIRYLDGGSRASGTGTSNYVVFPGGENMLKILARNGQELP